MNRLSYKNFARLVLACFAIVGGGCSSGTNYKWASFFFDGVPVPGSKPAADLRPQPANADSERSHVVLPAPGQPVHIVGSVHKPFGNGKCIDCHESESSQTMKALLPGLCFRCHNNFLEKAKVRHQPLELGECGACHKPHESPNKKLLVRVGRELCLQCHGSVPGKGKVKHKPAESDCMVCHDPHASDNKGLLRKPMAATCFGCHTDFLKPLKFKHDPAANGECKECHDPHQSDFKGLLIKPASRVCFECHDEADVKNQDVHKRFPNKECLNCHDPHGGGDPKFLKPGISKLVQAESTAHP